MAHDVFISHSAKDKVTGDAVCAMLESNGVRCWIAPRDVVPGEEWGKSIIQAINGSRVMVLVFSSHANDSVQIRKEVERAVNKSVIIVPFRIEDVAPGESLEYFIGNVHWMDAITPPLETHLRNLAGTIKMLLARSALHETPGAVTPIQPPVSASPKLEAAETAQPPVPEANLRENPPKRPIAEPTERSRTIRQKSAAADENIVPSAATAPRPSLTAPFGGAAAANKPIARRVWFRVVIGGAALLVIALVVLFFLNLKSGHQDLQNGGRLKMALVTDDSAKESVPPLHGYFDPDKTYGIERDLTLPGEIESAAAITDGEGRPALEVHLTAAAVERINNGAGVVGREVALVLDGRTVLVVSTVQSPLASIMLVRGNFTRDKIKNLVETVSSTPPQSK
ncbi:MAG: TIR domain-containing protein [Candidatus Acidiferrales bacterium]